MLVVVMKRKEISISHGMVPPFARNQAHVAGFEHDKTQDKQRMSNRDAHDTDNVTPGIDRKTLTVCGGGLCHGQYSLGR